MQTYLFHTKDRVKKFNSIVESFNPEDFGIPTFWAFERAYEVANSMGIEEDDLYILFEKNGYDLREFAYSKNEDPDSFDEALNALKLINKDQSDDDNIVYIDASDFGEAVVTDDTGSTLCTLEELQSDAGTLDVDGEYDSYTWKSSENLDEEELDLIIKGESPFHYIDDLENIIEDKELANFIVANKDAFTVKTEKYPFEVLKLNASDIFEVSLKDFKDWSLEEDENGEIELNEIKYNL